MHHSLSSIGVTCHMPHVTRHTSHVTRHTSHVTRHTSHTVHLSRAPEQTWTAPWATPASTCNTTHKHTHVSGRCKAAPAQAFGYIIFAGIRFEIFFCCTLASPRLARVPALDAARPALAHAAACAAAVTTFGIKKSSDATKGAVNQRLLLWEQNEVWKTAARPLEDGSHLRRTRSP
jgi:hypothetical protein